MTYRNPVTYDEHLHVVVSKKQRAALERIARAEGVPLSIILRRAIGTEIQALAVSPKIRA